MSIVAVRRLDRVYARCRPSLKAHRFLRRVHQHGPPKPPSQSTILSELSEPLIASPPSKPPKLSRLQQYAPRLHELSLRTGTPISSLALSFLILHELTAIIPLILLFFVFQSLGAGAGIVSWIAGLSELDTERGRWDWRAKVGAWYEEGQNRVERVGSRYAILGYAKVDGRVDSEESAGVAEPREVAQRAQTSVAGEKVADAIAAYVAVKALLPVRIGLSLATAPAVSRFALNPITRVLSRLRRT